jgi:hypothetical protein
LSIALRRFLPPNEASEYRAEFYTCIAVASLLHQGIVEGESNVPEHKSSSCSVALFCALIPLSSPVVGSVPFGAVSERSDCRVQFRWGSSVVASARRSHAEEVEMSSRQIVIAAIISCCLRATMLCQTQSQATISPRQHTNPRGLGQSQRLPLSLAHLYWHFLMYQNHLDTKAAANAAVGQDSSGLRDHLKKSVGFSDAEFAPIHSSAARLASEISTLDAKATAIKSEQITTSSYVQLTALTQQREADINAEIISIRKSLPPDRVQRLESFLTTFFAPTNAVPHPGSTKPQVASAGVR